MRVYQGNRFLATRALRLFLSAAILPIGFGCLSQTAYASQIELIEENISYSDRLVWGLNEISRGFDLEVPAFALRDVELLVDGRYVAKELKKGQKNLAYFLRELAKSLGNDGEKSVNDIISSINRFVTADNTIEISPDKKVINIFQDENERLSRLIHDFSESQQEAANKIISIIVNSCPAQTAVNEVSSAIAKDADAIITMQHAFALYKGLHAYSTAFLFSLDLGKQALSQLQAHQTEEAEVLKEECTNSKFEKQLKYEFAKVEKERLLANNKRKIEIESGNKSSVAPINLEAWNEKKDLLNRQLDELESEYNLFLEGLEQREFELQASHTKILLDRLAEFSKVEKAFYDHFNVAFGALGTTGFKTFRYGLWGTRETHPVWSDLDVSVFKLKEQGLELDNHFKEQFFSTLDQFNFMKIINSDETSKAPALVEFTPEEVVASRGVDLETLKDAIFSLFFGDHGVIAIENSSALEYEEAKTLDKLDPIENNPADSEASLSEGKGGTLAETSEAEVNTLPVSLLQSVSGLVIGSTESTSSESHGESVDNTIHVHLTDGDYLRSGVSQPQSVSEAKGINNSNGTAPNVSSSSNSPNGTSVAVPGLSSTKQLEKTSGKKGQTTSKPQVVNNASLATNNNVQNSLTQTNKKNTPMRRKGRGGRN